MAGIGVIRRTRRVAVLLVAAFAALAAVGVVSAQAEPPAAGGWPWGYKLNEEFSAKGLNATLWTPEWNGAVSGSCTTPEAVEQPGDGFLHLKLLAKTSTCDGKSHQTAGGLVTSNPMDPNRKPGLKGFDYSYGYVEWGVELPVTSQPPQAPGYQITCPANGCVENWPVFWSFDQSQRTEFDVFEGLFEEKVPGTGKRVAGVGCAHFHNWDTSLGSPAYEYPALPTGTNCKASGGGFHSYGLDWEPGVQPNQGSLTWYYDGVKLGEYESVDVKSRPQFLIAEYLQTKTAYAPFILPAEAKVDYVRVWQHPIPATSTLAASEVGPTTAKLNGQVNPDGLPTTYYFEYGKTTAYGNTAPVPPGTNIGSGTSAIPVSTTLSGLEPGATYHYRVVGSNTTGLSLGVDQNFTTVPNDSHPVSMRDPVTNQFWIYYRAADGYLWELYRNPTTGVWGNNKVPNAQPAAPGTSPVIGRNATTNAQWIYYEAADSYIWELYRNPTTGVWANTKIPNSQAAAAGSSPVIMGDPSAGAAWIYYRAADGYLWELYRNPTTGVWGNNKVPNAQPAAPGTSPVIGRNATTNAQWIYYEAADSYIWELYRNPTTGVWANNKIPNAQAAAPGSSPVIMGDPSAGAAWIYYRAADGYLWELYRNPTTGVWGNNKVPNAQPAAPGTSPVIGRNATTNAQWIYYEAADSYIWELYRNPTTGVWANNKIPNAQAAAPGSSPTMLGDPTVGEAWIEYKGSDGYVWELWRNPSTGVWANGKFPTAQMG